MKNILSKGQLSILIVLGILILDQVIKIEVKTNMFYNESIHITDWFYLRFIENPGMAFGMQIVPKAIQTIARTIFAIAIGWYIVILIKAKYKRGYIACISLILEGYTGWLHGKVVDMFYFPLFEFNWPSWMPFIGGDNFVFFSPVFNLADAAISCGVIILFLFYMKSLNSSFSLCTRSPYQKK